jgi:hypothetical protein
LPFSEIDSPDSMFHHCPFLPFTQPIPHPLTVPLPMAPPPHLL